MIKKLLVLLFIYFASCSSTQNRPFQLSHIPQEKSIIYVYRTNSGFGGFGGLWLLTIDVKDKTKKLGPGEYFTMITLPGTKTVATKGFGQVVYHQIDCQPGQYYFIETSVVQGYATGHPHVPQAKIKEKDEALAKLKNCTPISK